MVGLSLERPQGHLKIEVIGQLYRLYADDKLRASSSDETFESGSLGFRIWGLGTVSNLSIREYK